MKPTARRRLGKYILLGRLGAGGMGKIYLAHAPGPAGIEKLLVVKRLHSHLTGDPVLVTSFLDEARLSMALNHPNIVHTYDVGDVDGRYFMVMEYIDGQNLGVLLRTAKRSGNYPKSTLWAGLFSGVLEGLHAAHVAKDARGRPLQLIHRDVSPQNVLVTYEGMPKLVDFGIAKAAMRVSETDAGTLKGKYAYMSPEQVNGEQLDPRSDVFAAGIVLWEMLAGRRLYKAETIVRSVERILTEPPVSPTRVNPDVDERLARVCVKALEKDRAKRFASAEDMKEALQDALSSMGHRYRPAEARELMQRLFADVIDKQRAVLESSLNATGDVVDDDDDEPRRVRAGDSQSDLRMPQLRVSPADHESTTPSSLKRSPLVTDEDAQPRRPAASAAPAASPSSRAPAVVVDVDTAVGRQRPAGRGPTRAPRPVDGPGELTPSLHLRGDGVDGGGPTFDPGRTGSDVFAAASPRVVEASTSAPTATHSAQALRDADDAPPRRRSWLWPVVALGSGIVAAVVAIVVGGDLLGAPTTTLAPVTALTAPRVNAVAVGGDAGSAVAVGGDAGSGVAVSGDAGSVVAVVDAGAAVVDAGAVADGDETNEIDDGDVAPGAGGDRKTATRPPARPGPRPPVRVVPRATTTTKATTPDEPERAGEPTTAATTAAATAADTGFLTLDTVPWTTVYLGKKKLGETPLVKVPVPAGELELVLVNSDAKVNETYVARVKPGAVFRTRLDLR
jgi:serine/threonine-protein kinase